MVCTHVTLRIVSALHLSLVMESGILRGAFDFRCRIKHAICAACGTDCLTALKHPLFRVGDAVGASIDTVVQIRLNCNLVTLGPPCLEFLV